MTPLDWTQRRGGGRKGGKREGWRGWGGLKGSTCPCQESHLPEWNPDTREPSQRSHFSKSVNLQELHSDFLSRTWRTSKCLVVPQHSPRHERNFRNTLEASSHLSVSTQPLDESDYCWSGLVTAAPELDYEPRKNNW